MRTAETFRLSFRYGDREVERRDFVSSVQRDAFLAANIGNRVQDQADPALVAGCDMWAAVVGDELAGVSFVMDYLQLGFQRGEMSFYAWPVVRLASGTVESEDPAYRDGLSSFIGQQVKSVDVFLDDGLVLTFERGEIAVTAEQIRSHPWPEVVEGHGGAISVGDIPFD